MVSDLGRAISNSPVRQGYPWDGGEEMSGLVAWCEMTESGKVLSQVIYRGEYAEPEYIAYARIDGKLRKREFSHISLVREWLNGLGLPYPREYPLR